MSVNHQDVDPVACAAGFSVAAASSAILPTAAESSAAFAGPMSVPASDPGAGDVGLVDLDETTMERPPAASGGERRGDLEARVLHQLARDPALRFDSLTVRWVANAVMVDGVVRGVDGRPEPDDLSALVRELSGVDVVVNRLVVRDR